MSTAVCEHCGATLDPGSTVRRRLAGSDRRFCCQGCAGAYAIIHDAGLQAVYRRQDFVRDPVGEVAGGTLDPAAFLDPADPGRLSFTVGNIRCPTCIWLIERLLAGRPGVRRARGNFATHRFQVLFDPEMANGADLLALVTGLGYRPLPVGEAAARPARGELVRFATAAFFSAQAMLAAMALYAGFFHEMAPLHRRLLQGATALLAAPVVFGCGRPILAAAWRGLVHGAPTMDLLVALGVFTAYVYSLFTLGAGGETYFESAAMIVTLVLLGRFLEAASRRRALAGVERLFGLAPQRAVRLDDDGEQEVAVAELRPGDRIRLAAGDRLPVDAVLLDDHGEVDQAVVSGESHPRPLRRGESVAAGSVNLGGVRRYRVLHGQDQSFLARMAALVEEGLARRAPVQRFADRVAAGFVPAVIGIALVAGGIHLALGRPPAAGLLAAVAVLVVSCPCALGLATPMALAVAVGHGAGRGILFRSGAAVERLAGVDTVVLDKTGTVTAGRGRVVAVEPVAGVGEGELWRAALAAARHSRHPLARAVQDGAPATVTDLPAAVGTQCEEIAGRGVRLRRDGSEILFGSRLLLQEAGLAVEPAGGEDATASEVWLAVDRRVLGRFLVADPLRPGAGATVARLAAMGIACHLFSGDRRPAVAAVAAGLDKLAGWQAAMTPADKVARIRALRQAGRRVLMVGDGVNDGPALAAADLGATVAGGTDLALATSDVVLTGTDLTGLVRAVVLARRTMGVVRQNLAWAFSYNIVAIPLAATGRLAPVWAAALMAASSILVVTNSMRLARTGKDS